MSAPSDRERLTSALALIHDRGANRQGCARCRRRHWFVAMVAVIAWSVLTLIAFTGMRACAIDAASI